MKIFLLLTLGISAATAFAQPNNAPAPMKTGALPNAPAAEIESNVRYFASALNGKDAYGIGFSYVFGAKLGYFGGSEWAKEWAKQRGEARLQIERIESKVEGETATAQVFYRWQTPLFRSELLQERLALRMAKAQNGDTPSWQIVPTAPDGAAPRLLTASPPFLNDAASVIANPQPAVNGARAGATLSNLKQLGLAVAQFVQDYDEIYAFAPEYAEEALAPYMVKDAPIWKVPGREEKYRFNGNLSGKNQVVVKNSAQTVLFYEGDDETPIFRYDGKAAIAFADGHVALVSREDAKSLIWKP